MTNEGVTTLTCPVRGPVLLKYLGQLGLMLAMLTVVPFGASLFFGDHGHGGRYLVVILVLLILGIPLSRIPVPPSLQTNEALTITAMAFLISPLVMTYPLMGAGLSFEDALFEAVSGVTTTGLSVLPSVEDRTPSLLFARAWMQWYGGLGIAILSVALLMGQGIASKRLVEPVPEDNLVTTTRTHARRVLVTYAFLTGSGIVVLLSLQVEPLQAITLTLAAISTGGFSSFNDSLVGLESMPTASIVLFMAFCGAISLPLYARAYRDGVRKLTSDVELPTLLLLSVLASGLIGLSLGWHTNLAWGEAMAHGAALAVSAQSTTGFTTLPLSDVDPTSKSLLMASMMIGGSVGSTSGGVKILRFLMVLALFRMILQRACTSPHAVVEPWLGTRRLEYEDLSRALLLTILFVGLVFISWILFLAGGFDPLDAHFEVVSATGTVGLSTGITTTELPGWLKGVLCFDMLAGRMEIIALLIMVYPGTWRKRRTRAQ